MELYSFDSQVFKSLMILIFVLGSVCSLTYAVNYVCLSFDFTFLVTSNVFASHVHLIGFCLPLLIKLFDSTSNLVCGNLSQNLDELDANIAAHHSR